MKFTHLTACILFFASNLTFGQSSQMTDPDVLGIKIGMKKADALTIIKDKFQKSNVTVTKKEIGIGAAYLTYETQHKILLNKSKPSISEDNLFLNFLPDDTIISIRRLIRYFPNKQTTFDIGNALQEKHGFPVYFVHDDKTRFADHTMWSDRMLPGLSLVGMDYVQGGNISSGDFGSVTPYPYCWSEMLQYAGEQYDPKSLYSQMTERNSVALSTAKKWKVCGKALWVANGHETRLTYNATQTEIILADLSKAPDLILDMKNMLSNNPKTVYATVPVEQPKRSTNTPDF
ncbi:hypothetical protein [Janthinobacterium sp. PC23-8]|uniref:hypothetical protein n=1 Tax=Janthinobacterium sp. PC23-8 TaxID=2012679 RepID=UPI000B96C94A|nr:hypothetical protein [Janthinobacterium sp. PC23-8]OYO28996.1 hypothetical protein CD932_17870 [Janthinobacterium sp. PC23-8]